MHVAVLGSGIMGASTALLLARRGVRVTLFDRAAQPFSGASRWNEGKIHLGYLYARDGSLATARRILPGGLAFRPLVEDLIGCSLEQAVTPGVDTFLIHRQSVVDADAAETYYRAVAALAEAHGGTRGYLGPLGIGWPRRLTQSELEARYDTAVITAGFEVPERSVSTRWVADRFVDALSAETRIDLRLSTSVRGVQQEAGTLQSPLFVETDDRIDGPFDFVVNALWEGRLVIDAGLGLPLPDCWSHRFRLSVFLRTSEVVDVPNTVVATGPFGDVKNYNGRDFYLSWYPSGLIAEGSGVEPPQPRTLSSDDRARTTADIFARVGSIVRSAQALHSRAEDVHLEGGWVCACGQGSLADPASTLHRRDRIGITRTGSYFSVDTGKYSIAPWLAREVVGQICS